MLHDTTPSSYGRRPEHAAGWTEERIELLKTLWNEGKGASEIGANAFNIVSVWRNREHEERIKAASTDAERAELEERPGVALNVAKQRNGDFEGKIGLWFDQETYRYHSSFDRGMWGKRYVSIDQRSAA